MDINKILGNIPDPVNKILGKKKVMKQYNESKKHYNDIALERFNKSYNKLTYSQKDHVKEIVENEVEALSSFKQNKSKNEPKHYPKPKYNKCNKGHILVEVYNKETNSFDWDCPICIENMRKAREE